jgi:hypothetical protein
LRLIASLRIVRNEVDRIDRIRAFLPEDVGDRRGDDARVILRAIMLFAFPLEQRFEFPRT